MQSDFLVITKGKMLESNTAWAQGGISAVLEKTQREVGDNEESHIQDTLGAGAGLCKEQAVKAMDTVNVESSIVRTPRGSK